MLVAVVGACSAESSPELLGIWVVDGSDFIMSFGEDGSFAGDPSGNLVTTPVATGTFAVEGSRATLQLDSPCPGGTQVWEQQAIEDGVLEVTFTEDACGPMLGEPSLVGNEPERWIRVSPNGRLEAQEPQVPSSTFMPAPGNLRGVWVVDGMSTLISFSADGAYVLDSAGLLASAPADAGTYTTEASGVTLRSGEDSATCQAGDVLVFEQARMFQQTGIFLAMAANVAEDPCGRIAPGPITLIIISV